MADVDDDQGNMYGYLVQAIISVVMKLIRNNSLFKKSLNPA